MKHAVKINAGWEARAGRAICRWMLVWVELSQTEIAGCAAGYSGGGAFQLEKFYLRHSGGDISFLQIDNEEKIHSESADFSASVPLGAIAVSEDCQDEILSWHDAEMWGDAENLCLLDGKSEGLTRVEDMFLFRNSEAGFVELVLECIGITSKPSK